MPLAIVVHFVGDASRLWVRTLRTSLSSAFRVESGDGTAPSFSYSTPMWTSMVASPPSSRIMLADSAGQVSACSVHHQYSASVSPFQAKTGTPCGSSGVPLGPTATAEAGRDWG